MKRPDGRFIVLLLVYLGGMMVLGVLFFLSLLISFFFLRFSLFLGLLSPIRHLLSLVLIGHDT